MQTQPNPTISKTYDTHGIVGKTINAETARLINRTFGSAAHTKGESAVAIDRNGHLSNPELLTALADGLCTSSVNIVDLGLVATPMVCFGTSIELAGRRTTSNMVVTGNHSPPDYNGFKVVLADRIICGEQIQISRTHIEQGGFTKGSGDYVRVSVRRQYVNRIVSDVKLNRSMRTVVDCGNGVAGTFAPELFHAVSCGVTELFCGVDGHFPNHHPDPARVENLRDLVHTLQTMDCKLGLAFDDDGDHLGVVTRDGQVVFPDRRLMLFAQETLSHNPGGEVIFGVKCTGKLAPFIREYGGKATMWKTGHSLVGVKLKETGTPLVGKMSGHIFFKNRRYDFDDGLYTSARLLEVTSRLASPSVTLDALPDSHCTLKLQLRYAKGELSGLLDKIKVNTTFTGTKEANRIDDVHMEYENGFGLVHSSNTTPMVVVRFEADNNAAMARIQGEFHRMTLAEKPDIQLLF